MVMDKLFSLEMGDDGNDVKNLRDLEDADLWVLITKNCAISRAFLIALGRSPHLALGLLRHFYGETIDSAMFGNDESAEKSPWSLPLYFFAPGLLAIKYFWWFFDTNPYLVFLLVSSYAFSDMAFYLECALFSTGHYRVAVKSFTFRVFFAALASVLTWIFFQISPNAPYLTGPFATYTLFWIIALYNLRTILSHFDDLYKIVLYYRQTNVVDPVKRSIVRRVIRSHNKVSELLENSSFEDLYDFQADLIIGKGGFGNVFLGTTKKEPKLDVVIKRMKVTEGEKGALIANILLIGLLGEACQAQEVAEELQKTKITKTTNMTKHEVLSLKCVAALNNPSLLRLVSAHSHNNDFVIVTQRVNPKGLRGEPLHTRLLAVRSFFRAIADLHSAGIVHRDLKLENVCVSCQDHSQAVVIDFGICELPFDDMSKDELLRAASPWYQDPEEVKAGETMSSAAWRVARGFRGPNSDVWAAGLTAIEMLVFGGGCIGPVNDEPTKLLIWEVYRQGKSHHNEYFPTSNINPALLPQFWYYKEQNAEKSDMPKTRKPEVMSVLPNNVKPEVIRCLLACLMRYWQADNSQVFDVKQFCEMLNGMLTVDRSKRLTMRQAAEHPFWKKHEALLLAAHLQTQQAATASHKTAGGGSVDGSFAQKKKQNRNITLLNDLARKCQHANLKVNHLPESIVNSFKKAFEKYSTSKGELPSPSNLVAFLKETDLLRILKLTEESVQSSLWQFLDFDESGSVSKLELFTGLVILLGPQHASTKTRLSILFAAMDVDRSETISAAEFTEMYSLFGVSKVDSAILFHSLDKNHDGSLSLTEFLNGVHALPEPPDS